MATNDICCFLGAGELSIARKATYDSVPRTTGFMRIGNAMDISVTPTVSESKTPDYVSVAGGDSCVIQTIESVAVKFTAICHKMDNLAMAMYGTYSEFASAAVVNEPLIAFSEAVTPLLHIPDLSIAPVVTDVAGLITYVEGVDYEFTEGGALVVLDGGTIAAPLLGAANLHIDYTALAQRDLQVFTTVSEDLVLYFSGKNKDDTDQAFALTLYKVKLKAAPLDIVKDGKTTSMLVFEGVVMADKRKPKTGGMSQFGSLIWTTV